MTQEQAEFAFRIKNGLNAIFQQCYTAAVGANIHKGNETATKLGYDAGVAGVREFWKSMDKASNVIDEMVIERMEDLFNAEPEIMLAPASAIQNGKLIVN